MGKWGFGVALLKTRGAQSAESAAQTSHGKQTPAQTPNLADDLTSLPRGNAGTLWRIKALQRLQASGHLTYVGLFSTSTPVMRTFVVRLNDGTTVNIQSRNVPIWITGFTAGWKSASHIDQSPHNGHPG